MSQTCVKKSQTSVKKTWKTGEKESKKVTK